MNFTTGAFSVSAWVKVSNNAATMGVINKTLRWQTYVHANGTFRMALYDGTYNPEVTGSTVIDDGNWHHLVAVSHIVDDKLYVYVDGSLDGNLRYK